MKAPSLLLKYLLIMAAVCGAAVALTSLSLYLGFRSALDTALGESTVLFQEQMTARLEGHARDTTRILAGRLGGLLAAGNHAEAGQSLRRAAQLDGARLIVLFDADGSIVDQSGDLALLPRLGAAEVDPVVLRDDFIIARMPLQPAEAGGAVGQVFHTTLSNIEARSLHGSLSALVARYGRSTIVWALLVSALVMAAVFLALIAFTRRQVGDIRLLTRSTQRMTEGDYGHPTRLARRDELGQLATAFDGLRKRLQTATVSRDYLDKILDSMSEALFVVSPQGIITRLNGAAIRLLGQPGAALIGLRMDALLAPTHHEKLVLHDTGVRAREGTLLDHGGREVPVSFTISEIRDVEPAFRGFIIIARNIAERRLAEQRIRYLARIDALTKVPNRMQFQHLLQRAIARASRQGRGFALLYLDVDRFKDINDIYGHSAGDLCLETLTARLRKILPESSTIGRFAGDEFGIILEHAEGSIDPSLQLANTARSILRELAQPLLFQGHQIFMTASLGIATYPVDAHNVIDLVRSADSALYHAKRAGGDAFEFFDPEMNAAATERLMLKSRLRRAFQREELRVQYQPKVYLRSGQVTGAEALVRWDMPEGGCVLPSEFIPLAEESNLILDIGEWVLDRVCRDFRIWQTQMVFPGKIAVNLSLKQLRQGNFAQRVAATCRQHGVPPASLELEITESTLMEDPERTVKTLNELYAMGLSLAIDDFGTGYSSLSALQKFPINTLKIDQSFVREAPTNADDATIVSTIVRMGHGLKLDVVAEGVESPEQLAFLRATGCDYAQGLLFGEPMNAPQFIELLVSQRHKNTAFEALPG
ncbi:MAG: EAL domain-containing protein [Gammaproteobacteria bacterium]|nr:EAL domain-containing protein [Gammaproteobacteria bacterium]